MGYEYKLSWGVIDVVHVNFQLFILKTVRMYIELTFLTN